jgi:pimeloyl-ACP methyl ester carboxylesterase
LQEVNIIIGGLGGSPAAYEALRKELAKRTGRPTLVIPSLRFGEPSGRISARWLPRLPKALARQAVHISDTLIKAGYDRAEVYVYAHSLGTIEAFLFAAFFVREFTIKGVIPLCPAGIYTENFLGLCGKIYHKVLRDLRTRSGRRYWVNSIPHYFINPVRSIREGREVSNCGDLLETILKALRHHKIPVIIGLAEDDDVFSYDRTLSVLQRYDARTFLLPRGSHHSPDYCPEPTVAALLDATSSLLP